MTWTLILWIVALASVSELRQADAATPPVLLDCTSQIRLFYPELFTHCTTACQYSEWSDWEMVAGSTANVATSQCPSGEAYTETRSRSSAYQTLGCTDTTQSRQICMPDQTDRLIMSLGLGNAGNAIDSAQFVTPNIRLHVIPSQIETNIREHVIPQSFNLTQRGKRSTHCTSRRICHAYGKRSSKLEKLQEAVQYHTPKSSPSISESEEAPLPFNWNQHHHRFRRQTCDHSDTQYILFLLDTSGSISSADFQRMTTAISRINLFFCRPIRVAVMTFNHIFNLEFCFDCYDNTCAGRIAASTAMAGIRYRGGGTHTGGATKCACNFLLSQSCGLPANPACISVVYITDGRSNGPHNVCNEVTCLHNRNEVETFAIGIGNYDKNELNCIANVSDDTSIFGNKFEFTDFDDFVNQLNEVQNRLRDSAMLPQGENDYKCINPTTPLEGGGTTCTWPTLNNT